MDVCKKFATGGRVDPKLCCIGGAADAPEYDPTGRSAAEPGAKLDAGKIKAGILTDFSMALMAVAEVGTHGAEKYTRGGWQDVPDGITRYNDAGWRHRLKARHEDYDMDSGLLHKAHEAWNVLAELELTLRLLAAVNTQQEVEP